MFEWGVALSGYTGTYEVDASGRIAVDFSDFEHDWPDMLLALDGTDLLLIPASGSDGFIMGNRGGAVMPRGAGSYWPFRMLTGDDEQEVLRMIDEHWEFLRTFGEP